MDKIDYGFEDTGRIREDLLNYIINPVSYTGKYTALLKHLHIHQPDAAAPIDSRTFSEHEGHAEKTFSITNKESSRSINQSPVPDICPKVRKLRKQTKSAASAAPSIPGFDKVCSREVQDVYSVQDPLESVSISGSVRTTVPAGFEELNRIISLNLKKNASYKKFETCLLELINAVGLDIPEVAYKLGVDKSYVYQIIKGKKLPSRDKIIEIALLLQLSLEQADALLNKAGYTLYTMNKRDIIIAFCIENRQSLANTNLHLGEFGQKPL